MNNLFLFIALPYLALTVMLIGTIYLYRSRGMLVTALSSQFMESRDLYFGGLFMHWGIAALFFGHLAGFLFPRTVLAWNGDPVRLLILEVSALIFGISFLVGVILLIFRRVRNKKLHAVTTDMDFVVYAVLLIQGVTGVWIAVTLKWGSSWFASVLAPYLKSIFLFQPDISAVSALPLIVKVHIATAFVLVALIPFSRFMHFLVFPLRYFWRPYQVVIWNRDRKWMKKSTFKTAPVKPKNS